VKNISNKINFSYNNKIILVMTEDYSDDYGEDYSDDYGADNK
jgi:hypothetical protein